MTVPPSVNGLGSGFIHIHNSSTMAISMVTQIRRSHVFFRSWQMPERNQPFAWRVFLANRTEADFDEYRKHRAWTAWKYAMWDSGCKLPTQLASGQSRCFCGAVIDIKGMSQHVHIAHMEAA